MMKILVVALIVLLIVFFVLVNIQTVAQMKQMDYWEENSEWWWKSRDDMVTIVAYNPDGDCIIFETFTYHLRYKVQRTIFNKWVENGEMVQYNHEK